ncbi:hypothetical protein [Deinococcus fonticola]|uniref:hypothetical protein n=1 Tax=Deinococcus fonticola TaxID=2528713 RepID=UPI00107510E6|nr:hypothetical protein [Deinococcus fonticola]
MSGSSPSVDNVPAFETKHFLPGLLAGWAVGAALVLLVRLLGGAALTDPCRGHTLLALLMPLLLGPGGLAFAAINWRRPRVSALGLGFMVASLFPALYLGVQDIGKLRHNGCAGGYVVIAEPGGKSISTLTVGGGETKELTGRLGGYTPQSHPGTFTLSAQSTTPDVTVTLPKTRVLVGEEFPIRVTAKKGTPINTYTGGINAAGQKNGKEVTASGTFGIKVNP